MRPSLFIALVALTGALRADDDVNTELIKKARALTIEQHAAMVAALRDDLTKRLLTPDPKWVRRFGQVQGVRLGRILNRGTFEFQGGLSVRGGGAYLSFTTGSNDYNKEPDLELQQWSFHSGFAGGDFGVAYPIGVKTLEQAKVLHGPRFFLDQAPVFHKEGRRWQAEARRQRMNPPGPQARPKAEVGRVYLVRSVRWGESDVVAAVQVLSRDKFGVTVAWKVLKTFGRPQRQR